MKQEDTIHDITATEDINALLVTSDGNVWFGKGIGVHGKIKGEICFNVAMTGYQEIMTDPSYAGQIITFTFPHIGNVGCNQEDYESKNIFCNGIVLREPISAPSNFRAEKSLDQWLIEHKITGICGVDTRSITKNIRDKGARNVFLYYAHPGETLSAMDLIQTLREYPTLLGQDLTLSVSTPTPYDWKEGFITYGKGGKIINPEGRYRVVVLDYGIKINILRCLVENDFAVTVIPGYSSFEEVMVHSPDGVFLSNGPGDPFATGDYAVPVIKSIMEKDIPIFGICLGNQLLSLACGLNTIKMHRGHRGGNHPVKNMKTGKVEITSQNHGFCVSREVIPSNIEITHESLFDGTVEGIQRKDKKAFSVQYHPESSPGPHDSHYLFKQFYSMIAKQKR